MRQPTGAARTAGRDSSVRTGGMPCAAWPRRYGHRFDTWTDAEILRAERGSASGFCATRVGGCRVGMRYSQNSIEYTVDVHETRGTNRYSCVFGRAPRRAGAREDRETGVDERPKPRRCGSGPTSFWTRHWSAPATPRLVDASVRPGPGTPPDKATLHVR